MSPLAPTTTTVQTGCDIVIVVTELSWRFPQRSLGTSHCQLTLDPPLDHNAALRVGVEVVDAWGMTYIVQRKDRFYVVAYDGLDPLTGRERRRWHPVGQIVTTPR